METDLRVIKSKKAIEDSFISLVEIKGYENVSLIEIAEKAMVNRNTIYLHYGSKEGILEAVLMSTLTKYIGAIENIDFKNIKINRKTIGEAVRSLFQAITENIEFYRIVLTDTAMAGYFDAETNKIRKYIINSFKATEQNMISVSFLMNGVFGIIKAYIVYAQGSEEENIKAVTDYIILNVRHFIKKN